LISCLSFLKILLNSIRRNLNYSRLILRSNSRIVTENHITDAVSSKKSAENHLTMVNLLDIGTVYLWIYIDHADTSITH